MAVPLTGSNQRTFRPLRLRTVVTVLALAAWVVFAPEVVSRGDAQGDENAGVTLRWRDRLGERMKETTQRELALTLRAPDRRGDVREEMSAQASVREAWVTTLALDEQRGQATRAEVRIVEQHDGEAAAREEHVVLHEAEAIRAVRFRYAFPWPVAPLQVNQSWRIDEALAKERYSQGGTFDEIDLRFNLLALRRDSDTGRRIAQIVRHLERKGSNDDGTIREYSGRAVLEFDVDLGRAVSFTERINVEVISGEAVARGTRTVRRQFAYETVQLIEIAPRAEVGTTQTERSETVTEFALAAQRADEPERLAAVKRRIESVQTVERSVREVDDVGRPRRIEASFVLSRGYTTSEDALGEVLDRERRRGPLEGLTLELELDGHTGTRQLLSRDRVRRHLGRLMRARAAEADEDEPSAEVIDARLAEVEASIGGATHDPLAAVQLPRYALPVGFVWRAPEEAAVAAAQAMFAQFEVAAADATVHVEAVREFGSREHTAVVLTTLRARGTLAGQLAVEIELPARTYFDLEAQRPLASRGVGEIKLRAREGGVLVEGAGAVIASTVYHYSTGPNLAEAPLLGSWHYLPNGPDGEPDARRTLTFERTGRCRYVTPHLGTGEPVERQGTWRLDGEGRVVVAMGEQDLDVFVFEVDEQARLLTLTKAEDTRSQTGIRPWLPNTSASYRRAAE